MEKIFEIVQASAALEGCTLTLSECRRLLSQGVSSEGKTISEQLLCINLRAAYEKCFQLAAAREFWSVYRLKSIAALALRDAGVSAEEVSEQKVLQKICDIANERRLHVGSDSAETQYKASFEIHYLVSQHKPWLAGNNYLGRLLMNYLQYECRLEPTVIRPSRREEYKRVLGIATTEEIGEIFVSYMSEHCADKAEKEPAGKVPASDRGSTGIPAVGSEAVAGRRGTAYERRATLGNVRGRGPSASLGGMSGGAANRIGGSGLSGREGAKPSSRDAILQLLKKRPYLSTRELAEEIGISAKGIEKQLGILKASGRLRRIGPDKGGKWEVL